MSGMDEIKATFFEECTELMEQLEAGLLALEAGTQDSDTVDAVFRAVHSVKGGAGAFHLSRLVSFAHEFETVLDGLRTGKLSPTPEVIAVLLRSSDKLGDLVDMARNGEEDDGAMPEDLMALAAQIAGQPASEAEDDFGLDFAPVPLDFGLETAAPAEMQPVQAKPDIPMSDDDDEDGFGLFSDGPASEGAGGADQGEDPSDSARGAWQIGFAPLPDLLESGNEPLFLFRALQVTGTLDNVANDEALPTLDAMEPGTPYLVWDMKLTPTAENLTETEIESVFEFADDLCTLTIEPVSRDLQKAEEKTVPESIPAPTAEVAPTPPAETRKTATTESSTPVAETASTAPIVAPKPAVTNQPPKETAAQPPKETAAPKTAAASTIRVDLDRIDRLVNLVGELVISQSMLAQSIFRDGLDTNSESASGLDDLQQLTRDIQDSVMAIRAQPVRSLFQRMTRIVREAAQMTEKDVRMDTDGEATEIDKTVVERLADPLTHMIRNAIDHGLEPPAERIAAGKEPQGIVQLSARQQSDRVVIEVSDDGRGINRERVLARAIERGLVAGDKTMEPSEIDRLLFLPGFSTADGVSSLSGRGVGMDVVQRAIRDLNGTIAVASEPGKGCTISISLPLTLAILDGMIVRTSEQRMVIPLSAIIETQTVSAARIEVLGPDKVVVQLHDRFVPLVDLASGMGFTDKSEEQESNEDDDCALLFVQPDDLGPFALQVDAIEAQRQVVIKGLGESIGRIPCVSAATILGDGQVALIVDPGGLAATSGLSATNPVQPQQEARLQ